MLPYDLRMANGRTKRITHEVLTTISIHPETQQELVLDVLAKATHAVILGLPWLRDQNPEIDWRNQKISLRHDTDARVLNMPAQRHAVLADEETMKNIASMTMDSRDKEIPRYKSITPTKTTKVSSQHVREGRKSATPEIPVKPKTTKVPQIPAPYKQFNDYSQKN
jgi:hypothetical protein